ncbi:MAG: PorV/PorQ family protein [Bacteroidota bacterium]
MKRMYVLTAILLMVTLVAGTSDAQNRKAGINSAAFLKIGVGARQVGLGSAVTSLTGDVTNMYWNPAGITLATDQRAQAAFTYNKWFADLNQQAASISYNLEDVGTIGLGFMTFGLSGIPADRDVYPGGSAELRALEIDKVTSDTYDYRDMVLQVSYARAITDQLSLGLSAKYISEKIDDKTATAVAFDFGSVYSIGILGWNIGARLSNLGSDMKFYDFAAPIPLTFSIGTSMTPLTDDMNSLMVTVDAVKPQDGLQYYFVGGEYTFMEMISVRGGYKFNYSGVDDGGNSFSPAIKTTVESFTAGAGFMTKLSDYSIRVDYAFTKMDLVDSVHRITLSLGMK